MSASTIFPYKRYEILSGPLMVIDFQARRDFLEGAVHSIHLHVDHNNLVLQKV